MVVGACQINFSLEIINYILSRHYVSNFVLATYRPCDLASETELFEDIYKFIFFGHSSKSREGHLRLSYISESKFRILENLSSVRNNISFMNLLICEKKNDISIKLAAIKKLIWK